MVKVEVTKQIIFKSKLTLDNDSKKLRCMYCPVALALQKAIGWGKFCVNVYTDEVVFEDVRTERSANLSCTASLPPEVIERIIEFDEEGEMDPFEFEITLPQRVKSVL